MTDPDTPSTESTEPTGPSPVETADAPRLPTGQDVRVGPDDSDEPQAGSAEPTD